MKKYSFKLIALSTLSLGLIACGSSDSKDKTATNISTASITADYSITAIPNSKGSADYNFLARFKDGSTKLKLPKEDKIEAIAGTNRYVLKEEASPFLGISYIHSLKLDSSQLISSFQISLTRDKNKNAETSVIFMPMDFSVSMPQANETAALINDKDLKVQWSNLDEQSLGMRILQDYQCFTGSSTVPALDVSAGARADSKAMAYDIDVKKIVKDGNYDYCLIDLELTRERTGNLDPELHKDSRVKGFYKIDVKKVRVDLK